MISRDLDRLSVLQNLKNNQIKTSQAAESMGVSLRHVNKKNLIKKKKSDSKVSKLLITTI